MFINHLPGRRDHRITESLMVEKTIKIAMAIKSNLGLITTTATKYVHNDMTLLCFIFFLNH